MGRGTGYCLTRNLLYYLVMKSYDNDEEVIDKNQVYREHMERVSRQKAAEEEALKFSRVIRGVDQKKYKQLQHLRTAKEEWSDRQKLKLARGYQFLIGLMGFIGVIVIFLNFNKPRLLLSISRNLIIEINFIFLGCVLAAIAVMGLIGLQHWHDKVSDRINGVQRGRR